jgi:N-acetyl-anhydromuramyl-L-alanine amidase AmpD
MQGEFCFRQAGPANVAVLGHTSVYTFRVQMPGNAFPWYNLLGR